MVGWLVEQLHSVFKDFAQLQELLVHGCDPDVPGTYYKKKLDGNGCVELLNNLPLICERLFGAFKFDGGAADTALVLEERAAHQEAVRKEQLQRNARLAAQADDMEEAAKTAATARGRVVRAPRSPAYYKLCAHGLGMQVTVPHTQVQVLPADPAPAVATEVCGPALDPLPHAPGVPDPPPCAGARAGCSCSVARAGCSCPGARASSARYQSARRLRG